MTKLNPVALVPLSLLIAACGTGVVATSMPSETSLVPSASLFPERTQTSTQEGALPTLLPFWLSTVQAQWNQATPTRFADTSVFPIRRTSTIVVGAAHVGASLLRGALVLGLGRPDRAYLLALPSIRTLPLPGSNIFVPSFAWLTVSPDRKRLAYMEMKGEVPQGGLLHVVDALGRDLPVPQPPAGSSWGITAWLSRDQLQLGHSSYEPPELGSNYADPADAALFNLETGALQILRSSLLLASDEGRLIGPDVDLYGPAVFYSPQSDRVAVTKAMDATIVPQRGPATIFEVWHSASRELVWRAKAQLLYARRPVWVEGGQQLAAAFAPYVDIPAAPTDQCAAKLWLINQDGVADSIANCAVGYFSVSPDGTKIAVWLDASSDCPDCHFLPAKLSVMDLEQEVADVFLISDPDRRIDWTQYPIWSPDQRYIAFNGFNDDDQPVGVIVLDLQAAAASLLFPEGRVRAWMESSLE